MNDSDIPKFSKGFTSQYPIFTALDSFEANEKSLKALDEALDQAETCIPNLEESDIKLLLEKLFALNKTLTRTNYRGGHIIAPGDSLNQSRPVFSIPGDFCDAGDPLNLGKWCTELLKARDVSSFSKPLMEQVEKAAAEYLSEYYEELVLWNSNTDALLKDFIEIYKRHPARIFPLLDKIFPISNSVEERVIEDPNSEIAENHWAFFYSFLSAEEVQDTDYHLLEDILRATANLSADGALPGFVDMMADTMASHKLAQKLGISEEELQERIQSEDLQSNKGKSLEIQNLEEQELKTRNPEEQKLMSDEMMRALIGTKSKIHLEIDAAKESFREELRSTSDEELEEYGYGISEFIRTKKLAIEMLKKLIAIDRGHQYLNSHTEDQIFQGVTDHLANSPLGISEKGAKAFLSEQGVEERNLPYYSREAVDKYLDSNRKIRKFIKAGGEKPE